MRAGRSSATCCAGSSRPAARPSRASTTSTTRAARSTKLGASVLAVRRGEPVPEDGYHGAYVEELAAAVPDDVLAAAAAHRAPMRRPSSGAGRRSASGRASRRASSGSASTSTSGRREGSLHAEGWVERAIERLRAGGHLYEQDGALWFRSTAFGDDKDRVIIRSNGRPTYFAADIGYVTEKFSRGFDHLIYIWGDRPSRDRGAGPERGRGDGLRPRGGPDAPVRAGSRFVRDGADGRDVEAGGRVHHARRAARRDRRRRRALVLRVTGRERATIDFDIELAKKQSAENPVYYVQYAHARVASILRKAADAGLAPAADVSGALAGAPEAALARVIARLPEVVEDAVWAEETHGVTAYATELATQFHAFYRDAKVVDPDEPERSAKRLALAAAAKTTLANALGLLGISAPESM